MKTVDMLWVVAITLVGAWCRLRFLDAPIRYDEVYIRAQRNPR
jgi:hypothetical protein